MYKDAGLDAESIVSKVLRFPKFKNYCSKTKIKFIFRTELCSINNDPI